MPVSTLTNTAILTAARKGSEADLSILADALSAALQAGDLQTLHAFFERQHPADLAALLGRLEPAEAAQLLPLLGRVVIGSAEPLRYLSDSIARWHETVRRDDDLRAAGFSDIRQLPAAAGIVTFTTAAKT